MDVFSLWGIQKMRNNNYTNIESLLNPHKLGLDDVYSQTKTDGLEDDTNSQKGLPADEEDEMME